MNKLLQSLTKAELHIHIEGSLEPEMMFELAQRNKTALPYNNVAEIRKAYQFTNLQSFLDLYYRGMGVLQTEQDFYDLMFAYLKKVTSQNVSKVEIFFDPQGHTSRNVKWNTFMQGFKRAINDAKVNLNIDANLIMCFLRHLPESDAITTFEEAMNYRDLFIGVGLDSSEVGYPPSLFKQVFKLARDAGLYLVAHAGEEGDANYVWEAIDELGVHRIDHGNNAINDLTLIKRIANDKLALTMCPLSNQRLQSVPDLSKHQLRKFMDYGVKVTINSDDPAYFGGYVNENYQALADALNLSTDEITTIAKNSLDACFV
jgi:adenosine deaminase